MAQSVDVVGIGSCGIDYFAIVPRLLGPDEKINASRLEIHAGGVTGNNLTQVGRLGASAGWLGLIGDDDSGRLIVKAFQDDGLDVSGIETIPGEQSTFVWIPVDAQGERCIYMFPNVNGKITPAQVRSRFAPHIREAKHFHTEASQLPLAPVKEGMQVAREAGVRVIVDLDVAPSYFAQARLGGEAELIESLKLVDVLKPCKAAAREITGKRLRADGKEAARAGAENCGGYDGRGRMPHRRRGCNGPGEAVPCEGGGFHGSGRRLHGRTVVRIAARLGSATRGYVCERVRGNLLHQGGSEVHGKTR